MRLPRSRPAVLVPVPSRRTRRRSHLLVSVPAKVRPGTVNPALRTVIAAAESSDGSDVVSVARSHNLALRLSESVQFGA